MCCGCLSHVVTLFKKIFLKIFKILKILLKIGPGAWPRASRAPEAAASRQQGYATCSKLAALLAIRFFRTVDGYHLVNVRTVNGYNLVNMQQSTCAQSEI